LILINKKTRGKAPGGGETKKKREKKSLIKQQLRTWDLSVRAT